MKNACPHCGRRPTIQMDALAEVRRCMKSIDGGSPHTFWENRLQILLKDIQEAEKLIKAQLSLLNS